MGSIKDQIPFFSSISRLGSGYTTRLGRSPRHRILVRFGLVNTALTTWRVRWVVEWVGESGWVGLIKTNLDWSKLRFAKVGPITQFARFSSLKTLGLLLIE